MGNTGQIEQDGTILDYIMILQMQTASFALQYDRFMDKRARQEFAIINDTATKLSQLVKMTESVQKITINDQQGKYGCESVE